MSFGFPIMLQGQIWLLFMSIDNLIVAGFISVKDLGYYALAVSVTGYVLHMPRSIGAALFPADGRALSPRRTTSSRSATTRSTPSGSSPTCSCRSSSVARSSFCPC